MKTELLSGLQVVNPLLLLSRAFLLLYSTLITRGMIRKRIRKFESSDYFYMFGFIRGMMYI